VADDAQHILQRALLGEAMDCADGTAVFVWNEERKYVAVNEQACRLVGLSREELVGMPVGELSPDNASADIAHARRPDRSLVVELHAAGRDEDPDRLGDDANARGAAAVPGQPRLADKLASAP
jgi:PAS domain-containing protein